MSSALQYHRQGDLQSAEQLYREILNIQPDNADALNLLGMIAFQSKKYEQAIQYYQKALSYYNDHAGIFNNMGNAFKLKGDTAEAIASFQKAISLKPEFSEAYYNLGCIFNKEGGHDEAIVYYQAALRYNPDLAEAHYNMGVAFQEKGADDEAIACYQAALRISPGLAEPNINLGMALQKKGEIEAARKCYQKAIQINPSSADAWNNLGSLWKTKRRFDEAYDCYQKAIGFSPGLAEAHWNLAVLQLAQGNYEGTWKEYEWRTKVKGLEGLQNKFEQPRWRGEDITGRTILIHAEQGIGDTIHFIRYIQLVAQRGAKVIVEAQPELATLLYRVEGVHDFIPRGNPLPMFDVQGPLLSLPLVFGTTVGTIPGKMPYITIESALLQQWHNRVGAAGQGKVRVGLVWAGSPRHEADKKRSISLAAFSSFARIRDVEFFSLQKGIAAAEAKNPPVEMKLVDFSGELHDFADTAALIANLDLIISVDTAVAHLAGALGKPVWNLLPYTPDWRWMLDRDDSPWYPSMKLFRQPSEGDWERVISLVQDELKKFTADHISGVDSGGDPPLSDASRRQTFHDDKISYL